MKKLCAICLVLLLAVCLVACTQDEPAPAEPETPAAEPSAEAEPEQTGWVPERELNLIVQASAGGGSDIMARTFADIVNNNGFSPTPMVVENRPGGGGAVAFTFVGDEKYGDPYYSVVMTSALVITPLQGGCEVNYEDFTPVARLGTENYLLIVRSDCPWNDVTDFVEAALAEPGKYVIGGTGSTTDPTLSAYLEEASGIEIDYVPFESGSEVDVALLGGHIDVAWGNLSECMEYYKNGDFRFLAVANPDGRLEGLDEVPTFEECGYELTYVMDRGIVAAGGLTEEQKAFWDELGKKVFDTPEWQAYLSDNLLAPDYLGSDDLALRLKENTDWHLDIMTRTGLL